MKRNTPYDPDDACTIYPAGTKRYVVFEAFSGLTTLSRQRPGKQRGKPWVRDPDFRTVIYDRAHEAHARAKRLTEEKR